MATLQIIDNFVNSVIDTPQSAFVAGSQSIVVEAFTAANNSGVNASYKAYIQSAEGILTPIRPFKIVVWGEIDLGIGIVSQAIPPGGELLFECSALESIYFTVTAREIIT